jgi:deoxyribonuclease-2
MLLPIFLSVASLVSLGSTLSCLSETGISVDSWVGIKEPKGTAYYYYDSTNKVFELSKNSMNDTTTGALTYTTQQLWSSDTEVYGIWNDGIPNSSNYSYTYGHTKGYFALDSQGDGFLMVHSIPSFPQGPSMTSGYVGLGSNAWTYAQSLLCLSVSADTLDAIAYKYILDRPNLYDVLIPASYQTYKNITNLLHGKYTTAAICASQGLTTQGGMKFTIYGKTNEWNNDLYSECVTPAIETNLYVESWIRGSAEGPNCPTSGYDTFDVQGVAFEGSSWTETNDHSKWAVAPEKNILCIGDINRMTTQYERGGGTVCFENEYLASVFNNSITGADTC